MRIGPKMTSDGQSQMKGLCLGLSVVLHNFLELRPSFFSILFTSFTYYKY